MRIGVCCICTNHFSDISTKLTVEGDMNLDGNAQAAVGYSQAGGGHDPRSNDDGNDENSDEEETRQLST